MNTFTYHQVARVFLAMVVIAGMIGFSELNAQINPSHMGQILQNSTQSTKHNQTNAMVSRTDSCNITLTTNVFAAPCFGGTGFAAVSAKGGDGDYTYIWSDPNGQTEALATGLSAGMYTVTVSDTVTIPAPCFAIATVTITEPPAIVISATGVDALCADSCDGSASVTGSGGTGTLSYVWSDTEAQAGPTATGLCAGTYFVTATDANGCTEIATVVIGEPAPLTLSITSTPATCNGFCDGTAISTVGGGTPPYSYLWNDPTGQTANLATELCAGNYELTVTDANGCSIIGTVTVNEPPVLTTTTSSTPVSCNGGSDGTATVTASGGNGGYAYLWDTNAGNQNTSTATGLSAGTYTVVVIDANGCDAYDTVDVTEPAAIMLGANTTDVACNGQSTGAIDLMVSGGTPPYTYSWSNGATTQDLTNIPAGSYTGTVTDANGCIASATLTIIEPTALALGANVTDVDCNGASTGAVDLMVSGGTPPYTYSWSNGATTQDLTNIPAGSYTGTVTDANGCTASATVTVNEPAAIVLGANVTDVDCNGASTGAVDLMVSGGTPPYTYSWSNGATTQDLTNVPAGSYTGTVTDANGCTASATVTVNEPTAIMLGANVTDVDCNGASTGAVDLMVSGGTPPYTYSWSNGATSQDLTNVPAGSYTGTVTDANGCTASATVTVNEPTAIMLGANVTDVDCNGASTGAIDLMVSGGTPPYSFSWSNGATTEDLSNVPAGSYTGTVTDANGCMASATVTVNEPAAIVLGANVTNVDCNGASTGAVDLMVSGGTPPYTYSWSNGATTQDLTNVPAGSYTGTVTDANGCMQSATVTVNEPAALALSANVTDVACNGESTGAVDLMVSGGTPPYTYSWSNGATTQDLSNVPAGSYTGTVTDANGCMASATVTVNEPAALSIQIATTPVSCNGGNDGTITILVTGGTPGYTLNALGMTFMFTDTLMLTNDITAGNYTGTITDANGCTETINVTVTEPSPVVGNLTGTNPTCANACDGTGSLTISGGVGGYKYKVGSTIFNYTGPVNAGNLCAGTYVVSVADANLCIKVYSLTLTDPAPVTASATGTPVSCFNACDGTASASAAGGTGNFSYLWSNGASTASISGLCAGVYTVTVNDDNGCSATASYVVTQPAELVTSVTGMNVTCNGFMNGSVDLSVSGGTPAYTYAWSNGATTQDISGLGAGTYSVTVTDANGCSSTESYTVTEPTLLEAPIKPTPVTCKGACDGSILVAAVGGTGPYTFQWNDPNNQTHPFATGLCAGSYSVTVTDANGCSITNSAVVTEPAELVASATGTDESCANFCDGSASASATGGNPPYTFLWNTGATTATITGICAGNYYVEVTDAKGCVDTAYVTISSPPAILITTSTTPATCAGFMDGSATASASGGAGGFTYLWSNGATTATANNLGAGIYSVTVTDANGCSASASDTVGEAPTLLAAIIAIPTAICPFETIQLNGNPLGGTGAYTHAWTATGGSFNDATIVNPTYSMGMPGTYTITYTVTDANGCTASDMVTITVYDPPTVALAPYTTCSFDPVTLDANAANGTPPYTYAWSVSGGNLDDATAANPVYTMGMPGTYNIDVTVTDANGCTTSGSTTVTVNANPSADISPDDTAGVCGLNPVQLNGNPSGGDGNYTHAWSATGGNFSDATIANPIYTMGMAGTYTIYYTVTDGNGCSDSDSTTITIIACGSIGDYVWCDDNGDGIQDPGEAPIAGVVIQLLDDMGNVIGTMTTDANGAYDFTNLPAGMYTVNVVDTTVPDGKQLTTGNDPMVVNLGPGEDFNDADFGYQYTGSIGDYVWCDNNGDGIQDPGEPPIAGVVIQLLDDMGNVIATMTTDANGFYDFLNLPPGMYTVNVVDATVPTGKVITTGNDPLVVNLGPGEDFNDADFGYIYTGSIGDYVWCDDNGDGIQDPGEAPIAGVVIELLDDMGNVIATMTTDANGAYDFTNLPPGMYTVNVVDTTVPDGKQLTTGNDPLVVNLGPGEDFNDADFGYQYTGSIGDYVWCDTNNDGIQDPGEPPIAGVVINLLDDMGNVIGTMTTDANGFYDFTNLPPGTYTVDVVDSTVPDGKVTTTFNDPLVVNLGPGEDFNDADFGYNCIPPVLTHVPTPVSCNGGSDGAIDLTVTGGTGPTFSFLWSNGATTEDISGLTAGTYTVTVTDPNGCSATASETILEPPVLTAMANGTDATCFDLCNGTASVIANGGNGGYTYAWSNGATSASITGLCDGMYSVTVTDSKGCTATASVTIAEPTPVTASASSTDVTCNGQCDGTATVTAGGGTPGYTYLWDANAGSQVTAIATGLCAGNYDVTVSDVNGCTAIASVTVVEPPMLTATTTGTPATCNGDCDGTATATAAGGNPGGYSYLWSNGQTTPTAVGLCAGTYTVVVMDSKGCMVTASYTVQEPAELIVNATGTPTVSCNAVCDGSITISATGGNTGGYTWMTNGMSGSFTTTQTFSNLCAGVYEIIVTDSKGCADTVTYTIAEPAPLTVDATGTPVSCNGFCDGTATANPMGGTTPYSYAWNDPMNQTTQTATGLCAGTYTVTVTDANGCTAVDSFEVTENEPVEALIPVTGVVRPTCFGFCNGSINVVAMGGTGTYSYLWSANANNQVTATATGLCAGTYTVTVTDANGCSTTATRILGQPKQFTAMIFTQAAQCSTICNGVAVASTLGGTGTSNTYIWSNGQTTAIATGLCPGTYSVTATDVAGCTATATATVGSLCKPGAPVIPDADKTIVEEVTSTEMVVTAFPNPFSRSTTIKYTVPETTNVELAVYDITGKTIGILFNGEVRAGQEMMHSFEANELPEGMYFYRITTTDGQTKIGKLILTK